jgi:hypothetical protein
LGAEGDGGNGGRGVGFARVLVWIRGSEIRASPLTLQPGPGTVFFIRTA